MAAVREVRAIAGLTILDTIPRGFLECSAQDLHLLLNGPTLIELTGERVAPLFVSILLHGNEDSGLKAVQCVMNHYRDRLLPRSLMLLVGNVEAARFGLRRLEGQPDFNRIWPGTDHDDAAESRTMSEVLSRAVHRRAIAAIDLHNNTGRNPHYAVVCNLDPTTLGLAALFSTRVVLFRGIPGTQTASFTGLMPAVTAECGQPGEKGSIEAAARFLDVAINLEELPQASSEQAGLDIYHTLGVVRVKQDVSFGFGDRDAELSLDPALDENNFRCLEAGRVLGQTSHRMPLEMIDEQRRDVAEDYFAITDGELHLRNQAVPAMFTVDPRIIRQDCLCYLMERLSP